MGLLNKCEFSEAIILELIKKTCGKTIRWKSYLEFEGDTTLWAEALVGKLDTRLFTIQQKLEQSNLVSIENISISESYFYRWNYNEENDRYIRVSILYLNPNENPNHRVLVVCHREHKNNIELIADSLENNKVIDLYESIKLKSCKEFNILERLLLKNEEESSPDYEGGSELQEKPRVTLSRIDVQKVDYK